MTPTLETNAAFSAAFLSEIDLKIAGRNVLLHPFYQAWNAGTLTREALQDYAAQYYKHVAAFPTYLSAAHSNTPDAETRRILLQNLCDEEAGRPNHPELWLQFAEGMGVSRAEAEAAPARPETSALVDTFRDICRNNSFTDAIAALYAYESQIPEVSATKIAGLKSRYGVTDDATLKYFAVHAEADIIHRAEERALLAKHIATPEQAESANRAADRALHAVWNLLSGVCERHAIAAC